MNHPPKKILETNPKVKKKKNKINKKVINIKFMDDVKVSKEVYLSNLECENTVYEE